MGESPFAMHPRTMAAVAAHAAMHHAAMCSNVFANTLNASTTPTEIGFWDPASLVLCQEDHGYAVTAEGIAAPEAGEYKLFTSIYHESTHWGIECRAAGYLGARASHPRSASLGATGSAY